MWMHKPTNKNLWISSCLAGKSKINISTVITSTSNGKNSPFFLSMDGIAQEGGSSCTHEFESTHGRKM